MKSPFAISAFDGKQVGQIGILVRDIEAAMDVYTSVLGLGPWMGFKYGPENVRRLTYRGQPGRFSMRVALCGSNPQIELVEPVDGPSIYDEWLDQGKEGLHHVGLIVDSLDEAIAQMEDAGFQMIQSGHGHGAQGDGGFAYFDTVDDFSVILEAIEIPSVRRPPDFHRDLAVPNP